METARTHFVQRYEPGNQARVELVNGRILDVIHGRYFDAGTSVILQGGKIESMPGPTGESTGITPDFTIDLKGKTVLPSLYNTHIHLMMAGTSMVSGLSEMLAWDTKTANAFENICLLYEHGVSMATGNDTMLPCTPAMVDLELLVLDHVLKGMPDRVPFSGAEAVKIATINSARSLGLEDEFGSIETGKTADLIILDGDPLEDFRLIGSRVAALFMDGVLVINNCGLEVEPKRKA